MTRAQILQALAADCLSEAQLESFIDQQVAETRKKTSEDVAAVVRAFSTEQINQKSLARFAAEIVKLGSIS